MGCRWGRCSGVRWILGRKWAGQAPMIHLDGLITFDFWHPAVELAHLLVSTGAQYILASGEGGY